MASAPVTRRRSSSRLMDPSLSQVSTSWTARSSSKAGSGTRPVTATRLMRFRSIRAGCPGLHGWQAFRCRSRPDGCSADLPQGDSGRRRSALCSSGRTGPIHRSDGHVGSRGRDRRPWPDSHRHVAGPGKILTRGTPARRSRRRRTGPRLSFPIRRAAGSTKYFRAKNPRRRHHGASTGPLPRPKPHNIRPAEVTASIRLYVLQSHGIITVNSHGQPGARVSLKLKPTAGALAKAGGAVAIADAFEDAIEWAAVHLHRPDDIRAMILRKN